MKHLLIGGTNHGVVYRSKEPLDVIIAPKRQLDGEDYSMLGFGTSAMVETEAYTRRELRFGGDEREYYALNTMTTRQAEQVVWGFLWSTAKNGRKL